MWQFHITGGKGMQITKRKNDQQDVNEPFVSSDGKYLYYSEDMYAGGFFQYNKNPNAQIYVVKRYNFETGKTETVTGGPGGAARPTLSRDGKKLAFVKTGARKDRLYIHDLETGEEWPIYDQLNKDQQEAWAIFGVYPNFNWTPNDTEIVIWSQGKLMKVNVESMAVTNIPFTANVKIDIAEAVHFNTPIENNTLESKVIRHASHLPMESF